MLWQDEGEVALIARNITKFGLPVTYDGDVLITQEGGHDSRLVAGQRLWSWNTWLPYYATAISFKLFGESTQAARLPFALAGVGVLIVSYLLAKKMKINTIICLLILATNTIFYLYSRQARYYAFSMFFPLCAVYAYFSKKYFLYFLSLLASFHSNFVLAFGFNLPLIFFAHKNKATWLFLIQSFIWLWYFHPPSRYWGGIGEVIIKIRDYLNIINSFYFPLILVPLAIFIRRASPILRILIIGSLVHIIVISLALRFGQRYLLTLIPVFSLLFGIFFSFIWQKNKLIFIIIFPIFIFTNFFFIISEKIIHPSYFFTTPNIRYYFSDFLRALPKNYPGPIEGISKFLASEKIKDKSALIYTDYEINSLRFYFPSLRFFDHPSPDIRYWLPRHNWGYLNELTNCQKTLVESQTEKIVLDNFDTQWENMPDITYHQFIIDSATPRVTIYKVINDLNWKLCN